LGAADGAARSRVRRTTFDTSERYGRGMQLSRLRVSNFRNLLDVDIPLAGGAVFVGENRSGKSNLLHAIRLVLDPSLSSMQRKLTADDFSESLGSDPFGDRCVIEVSVEGPDRLGHAGAHRTRTRDNSVDDHSHRPAVSPRRGRLGGG